MKKYKGRIYFNKDTGLCLGSTLLADHIELSTYDKWLDIFNGHLFVELNNEEFGIIEGCEGLNQLYIILDSNKQFYSKDDVLKDLNWEQNLMDISLLCHKFINKLKFKKDEELSKESPDVLNLYKIDLEIETYKNILRKNQILTKDKEKEIYQLALGSLDERVSNGEDDKPLIREKLNTLLQE
jgi:hypothetical protein